MLDDLEALRASRRQFLLGAATLGCGVAAPAAADADLRPRAGDASRGAAPFFTNPRGYAARGYDVLGYFQRKEAVRGLAEHQMTWAGARWRFADEDARDAFAAAPRAFAPQFGGYCALAVGLGFLRPGDGQVWDLVDGRLYLHCSAAAQERWRRDPDGLIAAAERNWPRLRAV